MASSSLPKPIPPPPPPPPPPSSYSSHSNNHHHHLPSSSSAVQAAAASRNKMKPVHEFCCKVKYTNALPPLPFAPVLLNISLENDGRRRRNDRAPAHAATSDDSVGGPADEIDFLSRYEEYGCLDFEKRFKPELLPPDIDLGMPAEKAALTNPVNQKFSEFSLPILDHADQELLLRPHNERGLSPTDPTGPCISIPTAKQQELAWFRKRDFLAREKGIEEVLPPPPTPRPASELAKEYPSDMSEDAQVAAILKSFTDCAEASMKHPRKPNLTPVEVLPFFPSIPTLDYNFGHLVYDRIPDEAEEQTWINEAKRKSEQDTMNANDSVTLRSAHALLKPLSGPSGIVMSYFAPKDVTIERLAARKKRLLDDVDDEEEDSSVAGQYVWQADYQCDTVPEEGNKTLAVGISSNGAWYAPLASRVTLRKRPKTKNDMFNEYCEVHVAASEEPHADDVASEHNHVDAAPAEEEAPFETSPPPPEDSPPSQGEENEATD